MESPRRIGGPRALLPYEAELCNVLGISEKEYFEFVDLAEAAIYQRKKEYELIPDIVNRPQAALAALPAFMTTGAAGALTLSAWGQIIIGVALTAISYLLTPKPKTPETPPQLTVGGVQGRSRFAPQASFDSVQDLAVLGSFIPLVYARKGVRVNSQLLWSYMKTTGIGEILSVVTLFSNGQLGSEPSFDSFALGTTMLQDFSKRKLALYFTKGREFENRINTVDDRYDETTAPDSHNLANRGEEEFDTEDPFSIRIKSGGGSTPSFRFNKGFASVKTQSSKSKFGAFAPISNGNAYKVPWELVMFPKGIKDEVRNDSLQKLQKITHKYPRYSALIGGSEGQISSVNENTELTYRIYGALKEPAWESEGSGSGAIDQDKFAPWGSKDAKSAADTSRIEADERLRIGQQYLIGTALATCTLETNGNIWDSHNAFSKDYKLTIDESGLIQYQTTNSTKDPFDSLILQKVAVGAVSNTRQCDYTEIGIKSKVFRRMNRAPNVNAMVSRSKVAEYESKNGSISIGSVNKYIKRFSFFKFQMKLQEESNSEFQDVLGSVILGIEGNSPLEQYNTISIKNQGEMYDYRFVPVPGNYLFTGQSSETVYILGHNNTSKTITYTNFVKSVTIDFNGNRLVVIKNTDRMGNPEWVRGGLGTGTIDPDDPTTSPVGGQVVGLTYSNGDPYSNNEVKPTQGEEYVTQTGSDNPANYIGNGEYYSRQNGVVAIRFKGGSIREGWDTWGVIYGGTEIPNPIYIEGPAGNPPTGNNSWVTVEDAQGTRRKFRLGSKQVSVSETESHELWSLEKQILQPVNVTITTFISNTSVVSKTSGGQDRNPSGLTLWCVQYAKSGETPYIEWTIRNPGNEYDTGDQVRLTNVTGNPTRGVIGDQVAVESDDIEIVDESSGSGDNQISRDYWSIVNTNPNNAIADYFLYDSEDSSHSSQPEHEIVFVNEVKEADDEQIVKYPDLAMAGLRIHSTQEITSLSNLSAFITDGIKTQRLINDSGNTVSETIEKQSTNNFVEIAYDLLTNDVYGAAELIGTRGVNRSEMIDAAKYCYKNGFTWDGVIDKRFNLREFIFEHAAYNLLDFSIKGGQFSLRPSFPVNDDLSINYQAKATPSGGIDIKALFSDGNMRNLQVSFLSPEEREMFKATVLYRKDKSTSFPETKVKTFAYDYDNISHAELKKLPEEVFDLSNWCTNDIHAQQFAAIALATRKEVDHGITFETTPTSVLGVLPGDYIRVISEVTHTSRFNNGSVDKDGFVTSRVAISGTINVYYWKPGNLGQVQSGSLSVNNDGKANQGYLTGTLFAQVDTTTEDRLYKIESITYGEEGFIKVAASHAPLTSDNKLAVLYRAEAPANLATYFPELGA